MDKSRASKSVVLHRHGTFTIHQYPGQVSRITWMNPSKKNFGRPVKAVSRIGKESPWVKKGRGSK